MAASCVCGARCAAAGICGDRAGVDLAGTDAQSEIEAIIPSRQMLALRNLRLRPATISQNNTDSMCWHSEADATKVRSPTERCR